VFDEILFFCGVFRESRIKSTYYIHASYSMHGESSRLHSMCVCLLHECARNQVPARVRQLETARPQQSRLACSRRRRCVHV
jgi:hypothetical protein